MPRHDVHACLHDILLAAERIFEITRDIDLQEYKRNWIVRAAVERQFEIIGEALNRAMKIDTSISEQIESARTIVSFRNQVIHGYDVIDHDVVWGIIERHLSGLVSQSKAIQASFANDPDAT